MDPPHCNSDYKVIMGNKDYTSYIPTLPALSAGDSMYGNGCEEELSMPGGEEG